MLIPDAIKDITTNNIPAIPLIFQGLLNIFISLMESLPYYNLDKTLFIT